ncbi:MAG: glycosyltransferase [Actinomycetes bacterium]|jgi:glycosyltransferase involved in cell wall biosynthesis
MWEWRRAARGPAATRAAGEYGPRLRVMRIVTDDEGPARQAAVLAEGLPAELFEQRVYGPRGGTSDPAARHLPGLGRTAGPGGDACALAALVAEMLRFRPHIVHTHTARAGTLGRVAALLAGVPARVHSFPGHPAHGHAGGGRAALLAERVLARVSDRLVTPAARIRDDLIAAGVGRPGRYAVVPPGIRPRPLPGRAHARHLLGLPDGPPVVAYVGPLTGAARPDRLVEVLRRIHRALPEVRFAVCGEGELLGEVLAAVPGLGGTLHPLGRRDDVESVYAAADLLLLTSDTEGVPAALIEAGMAGLPVVAPRVGGVPEVVRHEETGLLAPPWARELAAHAIRLLRDEPARLRMGAAARAWTTERFAAGRLVADIRRLYTAIAVERGWWPPSALAEAVGKEGAERAAVTGPPGGGERG